MRTGRTVNEFPVTTRINIKTSSQQIISNNNNKLSVVDSAGLPAIPKTRFEKNIILKIAKLVCRKIWVLSF
jgi:hypothetical protein